MRYVSHPLRDWTLSDRQRAALERGRMRDASPQTGLRYYQREIERMVDSDATLGEVEDAIGEIDLSDEQKSALWLWAWALLSPRAQRERAVSMLAAVEN
jgi:hypothetical protein